MGVSGSGKTTIGQLLEKKMSYVFVDADDYHSDKNNRKHYKPGNVKTATKQLSEDQILSSSNNMSLSFSNDTLLFDTVFTTVGSATRSFKVYNNSHNDIYIFY